MPMGAIEFFAGWLFLAMLGAGLVVVGWEFVSARHLARWAERDGGRKVSKWLEWPRLPLIADALAAAVAVSLPWSTTATGILIPAWFVAAVPVLDRGTLRRTLGTAAGGLPLVLLAIAVLGMAWADVSFRARLGGLDGFLKLLFIPLLLAQMSRSERGWWVVLAFLGSATVLLLVSWCLALIPGLPWHGNYFGVPVKDYIFQSGEFALCTFALLGYGVELWRSRRPELAVAVLLLAALFFANIAYVELARTTLVTSSVLLLLFGFRNFGWIGMFGAAIAACLLAGALWVSSDLLRERVTGAIDEVQMYRTEHAATSSGLRLEYWKKSIEAISKSPIIGFGTGSIPEVLAVSEASADVSFVTVNPHNQIFVVAIQLGFIGTVALMAMWAAHIALFSGNRLVDWIGLAAVVQLVGSSLFNPHLSDFSQGWLYVFAVGVLGGMVQGREAARRPLAQPLRGHTAAAAE
jgi:O-antigen ligase